MSIISILNQIKNEEVVLPAIQRDFVWGEDRIKHLLDSILRGYPIGITLIWETYHDLQYRRFQDRYRSGTRHDFLDNDLGHRRYLVLDGQQRLQSLYVALYGSYEGRELYFDLLSGCTSDTTSDNKFRFEFADYTLVQKWNEKGKPQILTGDEPTTSRSNSCYWLKVSELLRMSSVSQESFVAEKSNDLNLTRMEESRMRVNINTFKDAMNGDSGSLQVSIIDKNLLPESEDRKSIEDILEIFIRINTGGIHLTRSDLIFSMLKLNWKESSEALPDFVDRINEGNSFHFDNDFVIRCLFAVSDFGTGYNLDVLRNKGNFKRLRENFQPCCEAISAAVDFVKNHCWLQSSHLMGGVATFVPVVYYLYRIGRHRLPLSQTGRLRISFFLLAFSRTHTSHTESRLNKLIHEIRVLADRGDTSFPSERYAEWIKYWGAPNELNEDLISWNHNLALHLVQGLGGGEVKYEDNRPEVDHIFPKSTLREMGVDESMVNHLANYWILARGYNRNKSAKDPAIYFADVAENELRRALIDKRLLDYNKYDEFIATRTPLIVAHVKSKIEGDEETPV